MEPLLPAAVQETSEQQRQTLIKQGLADEELFAELRRFNETLKID